MSSVLDGDDRTVRQRISGLFQYIVQSLNHVRRARVPQSKNDDADDQTITERDDFSEIEIECQNDPLFGMRQHKDCAVGQLLQTAVSQMNNVMALSSQPLCHSSGNTHVQQETHAVISCRANVFGR